MTSISSELKKNRCQIEECRETIIMFDVNLEPWEKLPEEFEKSKTLIMRGSYPLMPEEPKVGIFYRIYPEKCISGNGTAYHGGVRIGKNPKKLLIYFNGGGVSYDEYSAARGWNAFTGNMDGYYCNDGEWVGDYFLSKGMNAKRDDNPFLDWSAINILYCNGDFHCGNGDFPYTALDGSKRLMPYHGYKNTLEVIRMAKKWLPDSDQILIAGSSAGGFGVALMADDVISEFPNCKDITCVVDSSVLFCDKWQRIAREVWHSPEHIWKKLKTDNLMLDSYAALYEKYGDDVGYLFMCSIRDALLVVSQNDLDGKGHTHDIESGIKFQEKLAELCSEIVRRIPKAGLYIFTGPMDAPGYDDSLLTLHCALNNPFLFDHKEEGKNPCEWILNAMDGKIERLGLANLECKHQDRK